jgi:hypothetical protein
MAGITVMHHHTQLFSVEMEVSWAFWPRPIWNHSAPSLSWCWATSTWLSLLKSFWVHVFSQVFWFCYSLFVIVTKYLRKQLKEEKIYLASQFHWFQSLVTWLHCFWWGKTSQREQSGLPHSGQEMESKTGGGQRQDTSSRHSPSDLLLQPGSAS